jgi:hypothetical protein
MGDRVVPGPTFGNHAMKERSMQRELTTKWSRIRPIAPAFLGMALFVGCGDSATTGTGDAASAYAALSAELQQCASEADSCNTAANGDATKEAACETAEKACKGKTSKDEDKAHGKLRQAAAGCYKHRGHGHDDDGGVSDKPGRDERRGCVEHHAPRDHGDCLDALLSCLESKATPGSGQDAALTSCVADAHTCIMGSMPKRGDNGGHMGPGNAAGAGAPTGHAGSGGLHKPDPMDHAGTGGGFVPPGQHTGAGGGFVPPSHGGGAAGGFVPPAQHTGAAGEDHSAQGHGHAAGGAGGAHP